MVRPNRRQALLLQSRTSRGPREPSVLRRGKRLEAQEKAGWSRRKGEELLFEKRVVDPRGKRGRLDIFVRSDDQLAAIGEVKATNWDKVRPNRVRALASRHARQVWRYIDTHLGQGLDVSPGIIYPRPPRSSRKRALVEETLNGKLIQCVWRREPPAGARSRGR